MIEKSYVMVKPEFANYRDIINEIRARLIKNGLSIIKEGYVQYDEKSAKRHYAEHVGKDFYPELEKYITSDKAYGMIVGGENAIAKIRLLVGATKNPAEGTIRYDIPKELGLPLRVTQNVVHASDSENSAKKEIEIFENILANTLMNNLE